MSKDQQQTAPVSIIVRVIDAPKPGQHFELIQHAPEDHGKTWAPIRICDGGRMLAKVVTPVKDAPDLVTVWFEADILG